MARGNPPKSLAPRLSQPIGARRPAAAPRSGVGMCITGRGALGVALERSRELAQLRPVISGGRAARGLIGHRGLPGGRAPHAAAAAPAKGMEVPTLGSGLGAFSGPLSRARHRRGGRAVIRVIARLPNRGCSGPQAAGRGRGRGAPQPLARLISPEELSALLGRPGREGAPGVGSLGKGGKGRGLALLSTYWMPVVG